MDTKNYFTNKKKNKVSMGLYSSTPLPTSSKTIRYPFSVRLPSKLTYFHVNESIPGLKVSHEQLYLAIPKDFVSVIRSKWSDDYVSTREDIQHLLKYVHNIDLHDKNIYLVEVNEEVFTRVKVERKTYGYTMTVDYECMFDYLFEKKEENGQIVYSLTMIPHIKLSTPMGPCIEYVRRR